MKKKLLCFTLVLFMIFGYSTQALPNKVYAEVGESFYSVEKLANEDSSNVQIQLNVDEDTIVNQVVYPDESITVEDLTQYTYSVDQNNTYVFTISYTDSETQEVKEEKVTVEVTEIVEPEVDDQEASAPETTVQQQPTAPETTTQQQLTVEETTPTQKANVTSKAAENSLDAVYVSASGDDETGDGTQDNPVATLTKAVDVAKDGGTIYVMSDLTMYSSARYYGKDLTITSGNGGPYTLTRGDDFGQIQDAARSTYNPALIEVDSTDGTGTASLTLTNIVLDDAGKKEGSYFIQADSEGDGHTTVGSKEVQNTDIVQDGIIATYNGVGTITLGNGAILKNYGGMSAVRLASGVLVMEEGSQIIDDKEIKREKGTTGSFGPAGALWLQGGTLTIKGGIIGGSNGATMNGRAVYVDGGTANIGGTIQNITGADAAWQGQNGIAVHLRSGGEATLTSTGKINNVTGEFAGNNSAIWSQYCNFTADKGSHISKVDGIPVVHFDDLTNDEGYTHKILLDGIISDCNSGKSWLYRSWYGLIELGENGVIENCQTNNAGGLIYSNNGSHYIIRGTIQNNTASKGMIYMANQGGGRPECIIESPARIIDNSGLGIRVNNGSLVTMNGGEISRNSSYGVQVSGKSSRKGVTFIMNGGTIADNGNFGIDYAIGGNSKVVLNQGSIHGNGEGTELRVWNDYTDSPNVYPINENDHLSIASNVLSGQRNIQVQYGYSSFLGAISLNRTLGTITLDEDYEQVGLAYAKHSDASDKIKELVAAKYPKWTVIGEDAYWIKTESNEYHLQITRPDKAEKTGLYVAYIPVNEDGTIPTNAELIGLDEVENKEIIDVTLHDLKPGQAYAVMFVNNGIYSLAPDDITIYTGGGQGTETSTTGFPEYTLTDTLDEIETLKINDQDTQLTGDKALDELQKYLTITYTDKEGKVVSDDRDAGEYTATLTWNDPTVEISINENEVDVDEQGGTVIVRHTSDKEGAISGEITHSLVKEEEITSEVEHATAIANGTNPKFYTNNDENRQVEAAGIQLLDDSLLLEDENDNRQELMEEKAKEVLKIEDELGTLVHFDFHYLDLVDAYNGNAWVSASNGTTVYLPYPEGTDATTNFSLVHYKDLHREYGITGQENVEEAIKNCESEPIECENTEYGIKFTVNRSGFSPFALVWSEHTGKGTVTINYKNADTGKELRETRIHEFTIGEDYDVSQSASKLGLKGYHIDRVEGIENEVGTMQGDVTITVWYKNDAPVIKAEDVTIHVGDEFDPYDYVEVSDREWNVNDWGNIIDRLKVESNVDVNKAGVYKVTYSITDCTVDNRGTKTTTKTIKVTVLDDSDPMEPTDPTDPVNPGDNDNNKPTDDSKDPDIVVDVKPDKSTETTPDKTTESTEVKTGDSSPIMIYALGAGISLVAIAYMVIRRRRDM